MTEWMLANVIDHEFDKVVGKTQYETGKAMHIGFGLSTGNTSDQYRVCHMYIFAPCNYVHVAIQEERIDRNGKRHVEPMEHLCYHDSCWRDSIQQFIFKRRGELGVFRSFDSLFDWYDVLTLSPEEREYLHLMDVLRGCGTWDEERKKAIAEKLKVNPFDNRSCWAKAIARENAEKVKASETEALGLPARKVQVENLKQAGFGEEAAHDVVDGRKSRAKGMKHVAVAQ